MKKLIIASLSVVLAVSASAQSGKVISAYNAMSSYEGHEGATYLEDAAKNIDLASQDETTSKQTKTWWYRAKIYSYISAEPATTTKYPKASLEAVLSFQKMQALNEPKFKDWADAVVVMKDLTATLFNAGVTSFTSKNYKDAYTFFMAVSDVNDILVMRNSKVTESTLSGAVRNAALSAENSHDTTGAIATYKKYLTLAPDSMKPVIYQSLITLYKKKDLDEAKRLTDEGLAKYPDNKDLIIDKINFFFNDHKQAEAIEFLKKLAAQDPKNESVLYNLAVAYETAGDTIAARKGYDNVLAVNPNNFDANLGLGAMLFNKANAINKQMNALSMSTADQKKFDALKVPRNALFSEAKPYLLKAQSVKPEDPEVKKALTTIDAIAK
jgi:tetratricopeptide (TPR) repeat protein